MSADIQIQVKCPNCNKNMHNADVVLDGVPAIELDAKVADKVGNVYLSSIYGSFSKKFVAVDDIVSSICVFSCNNCHQPLPILQICECKAPMIGLQLIVGGNIKICTRNGCKHHFLEFEDVNDAMSLLVKNDSTGLG